MWTREQADERCERDERNPGGGDAGGAPVANANAEAAWPDRNEVVWHLDLAGDRHAVPVAFVEDFVPEPGDSIIWTPGRA